MTKFFRKIRKNLVSEGKTGKYLRYALGEIILLVIGILIALQINNWNERQKENKREKVLLSNLVLDLEEQIALLDDYIIYESGYTEDGIYILNNFAKYNSFTVLDSIVPKLNYLTERRTFNPINTTFQELSSAGDIRLIRNVALKREIIRYYHELERWTLINANNNTNLVDRIYNPVIHKNTLYVRSSEESDFTFLNDSIFGSDSLKELRLTSNKMFSNPENTLHIFNVLELRTLVAKRQKEAYEQLKVKTKKLIHTINEEVDDK